MDAAAGTDWVSTAGVAVVEKFGVMTGGGSGEAIVFCSGMVSGWGSGVTGAIGSGVGWASSFFVSVLFPNQNFMYQLPRCVHETICKNHAKMKKVG